MTQGEFEKRIEELDNSHYENVMTIPTEDALKMIEEAKQEFMNCIWVYEQIGLSVEALKILVKKWFGDS